MSRTTNLVAATVLLGAVAPAYAQDETAPAPPPDSTPTTPGNLDRLVVPAEPGLTLPKGTILIGGSTLGINLSTDRVAEPISVAPSIWYGVTDKITIGLTHDGGTTTWTPRPAVRTGTILVGTVPVEVEVGAGVCVTSDGCTRVYDNVGLDGLYAVMTGRFSLAVHPALEMFSINDGTLQLRAGALGRFMATDKLSIVFDPRITIPVTDRSQVGDTLDLPVWLWFAATPKLGAYFSTGLAGPFDGLGDEYVIPVGFGVSFSLTEQVTLGADLLFGNLAGKDSTADGRQLGLRFGYRI